MSELIYDIVLTLLKFYWGAINDNKSIHTSPDILKWDGGVVKATPWPPPYLMDTFSSFFTVLQYS